MYNYIHVLSLSLSLCLYVVFVNVHLFRLFMHPDPRPTHIFPEGRRPANSSQGTTLLPIVIEGRLVIVIFLGWSIGARENGPPCIGNCKVIIHFDGHFCYRLVTCGMTFRLAGALPWAIPGRCLLLDLFFGFVEHW